MKTLLLIMILAASTFSANFAEEQIIQVAGYTFGSVGKWVTYDNSSIDVNFGDVLHYVRIDSNKRIIEVDLCRGETNTYNVSDIKEKLVKIYGESEFTQLYQYKKVIGNIQVALINTRSGSVDMWRIMYIKLD